MLTRAPSSPAQVNQQQQDVQQLNQDLEQQKAEVAALRGSLESKERVGHESVAASGGVRQVG